MRVLPRLFRKTTWKESHAFSKHRFRIDPIAPLPLSVDRYQILLAARSASLSEEEISVLNKCKSPSDGPCSTIDEPEFKIEIYHDGSLLDGFIYRIKNLKQK